MTGTGAPPEAPACAGESLGGAPTIPALIVDHRRDYFAALDKADEALRRDGRVDVRDMEALLSSLLAKQLTGIYKAAGGALNEEPVAQKTR